MTETPEVQAAHHQDRYHGRVRATAADGAKSGLIGTSNDTVRKSERPRISGTFCFQSQGISIRRAAHDGFKFGLMRATWHPKLASPGQADQVSKRDSGLTDRSSALRRREVSPASVGSE
jgi:hypothetical protein